MTSLRTRYLETVIRLNPTVVATLLVSALVFSFSALIAATGEVPAWERGVFHAVNDLPDAFKTPMWLAQLSGLILAPLAVALVAALFRHFRLAVALVALIPLKLLVENAVVKQLVERERPATSICDLDETCGNFRDAPLQGLSFVSGHAIIVWAMCALLWLYVPRRWRWALVALAVANGVARVYLGAHNPLDIVGGAAVGVGIGTALAIVAGPAIDGRMAGN